MSMLSKLWLNKNFSLTKWEATRTMGRTNYVIRYGVLRWGLLTALGVTLLSQLHAADCDLALMTFSWSTAFINAVIFCIGGYFIGSAMWVANETSRRGSP